MSEGPALNKRCLEATLIRHDDGTTTFDPGLYSTPKATDAAATPGVGLHLPQTKPDRSTPISLYDSLPSHKRALLAHLPCGCRAYADDADLGIALHRRPLCKGGLCPMSRHWCRSIETLTDATCCGAADNSSAKENIKQSSSPPDSSSLRRCRLNHELDPSVIRLAVTGPHCHHQQLQRPRSFPEEDAKADEVRGWKGRGNVDDELPQVVTECRPLITMAAAVTHGCLYKSPSMTYAVATLPVNPPKAVTTSAPRIPLKVTT